MGQERQVERGKRGKALGKRKPRGRGGRGERRKKGGDQRTWGRRKQR